MTTPSSRTLAVAVLALACVPPALAQATVKADGRFRSAIGLGASLSSGNSKASNLSFTADAVRATDQDKSTLYMNAQYARTEGVTTAERARLGGRHDFDLGRTLFAFGALDFERNKFANLQLRSQVGAGLGYHLRRGEPVAWDVFGGLGYARDSYIDPMLIDERVRSSYGYATLMLGQESTHRLSSSTSFKQRLVLTPNLKHRGEYRATWDAGLAVAMSNALSLNLGFNASHNSEPGPGRRATDTLLTTGVSMKFD